MNGTLSAHELPARELLVRETRQEADGVLGLVLADPAGAHLDPWEPGAHLEVMLPSGRIRHYSLSGDPADRTHYRLGILREPSGRGGSEELHTTPLAGQRLRVRGPRNHFPLVAAERYVFLAGGIGITPLLPMVRQLATASGSPPWSLLYGGRTLASMAYRDEAARLPGEQVTLVPQDTDGHPDLDKALANLAPGTAVYACGPGALLQAVEERCARLLPPGALHLERFSGTAATPEAPEASRPPNAPESDGAFDVRLGRSGRTLRVPSDRTLLDVVRDAEPDVAFSCEEGWCGTCETKVLEGVPEHNDTVLTDAEREAGTTMMICVGRSKQSLLALDL
ncbi:PDR/VanB family oxidoreductase [Streptomyces sp. N2-109]|uniref:PDR/VanB family oxidoreductase n=1 Tax=Streptomyces gossypii TaxID=2883101 RepID=A0ABT2K5F2_9ACTN|nr:PDR/VanB family oxidoreductase [Streptomyces gossypii]MCT2594715.1 PDR/VanB family oxidoreductase [Streptomyces gossypii]